MRTRRKRMAGYIRESDEALADSITIDSAAKAIREYGKRQGYIYEPHHEYKEAITAFYKYYYQRPKLMEMLQAAKRHEFDVLVITEVRSLSRLGAGEVSIIHQELAKSKVELEFMTTKFSNDPIGKLILSFEATDASMERERFFIRSQRGRNDRIVLGHAPNPHSKPAYGYIFVDTDQEIKGRYELDERVVFVDSEGKQWTAYMVVIFIYEQILKGVSLTGLARLLNQMGIPTPKVRRRNGSAGFWQRGSIHSIIVNPIYTGNVYANRFVMYENPKTEKRYSVKRPKEEWRLIEDIAPAIIDQETFEAVQRKLESNKQDATRNNDRPKEEHGLLKGGYIFCGICGNRMTVNYPSPKAKARGTSPWYSCQQKNGMTKEHGRHRVQIHVPLIEKAAFDKIVEIVKDPNWIRAKVDQLRSDQETRPSIEQVQASIEAIKNSIRNLYLLAQSAVDDETVAELQVRMMELGRQKRGMETMLSKAEEKEEENITLNEEIDRFEQWAAKVRTDLDNPNFVSTYDHLRHAIKIIGIRVIVYPSSGGYPDRYTIDAKVPDIMKQLDCVNSNPRLLRPIAA